MEDVLKVAAVAVAAALCAVAVKKHVSEMGMTLALAAGVLILGFAIGALEQVRRVLDQLAETAHLEPAVLAPVIKTVGISLVTRWTAEICRDAKEGGIASFVETAGTALALFTALPLVEAVLSMVSELL